MRTQNDHLLSVYKRQLLPALENMDGNADEVGRSLAAAINGVLSEMSQLLDDVNFGIPPTQAVALLPAEGKVIETAEQKLPRFDVTYVKKLGEGASGAVWHAVDDLLDRQIAVKLLTRTNQVTDEDALLREARGLARVAHPNLVGVYAAAWLRHPETGLLIPAILMELLEGDDLHDWSKSPRNSLDVLRVASDLLAGLNAMHEAQVPHGDLHTQNVRVIAPGRAKIIDWGNQDSSVQRSTIARVDAIARDVRNAIDMVKTLLKKQKLADEVAAIGDADDLKSVIESVRLSIVTKEAPPQVAIVSSAATVAISEATLVEGNAPAFNHALALAQADNQVQWRRLETDIKRSYPDAVKAWRKNHESKDYNFAPGGKADFFAAVDELVDLAKPRLNLALAGVLSNKSAFINPKRVAEDLVTIPDWNRGGAVYVAGAPNGLALLFHFLYGATCFDLHKPELAIQLAQVALPTLTGRGDAEPLWQQPEFTCASPLFNRNYELTLGYVRDLYSRLDLAKEVFGSKNDFDVSLAAYSMTLSLLDMADFAKKPIDMQPDGKIRNIQQRPIDPVYRKMSDDVIEAAARRSFGDRQVVDHVCDIAMVTRISMADLWPHWEKALQAGSGRLFGEYSRLPLGKLG